MFDVCFRQAPTETDQNNSKNRYDNNIINPKKTTVFISVDMLFCISDKSTRVEKHVNTTCNEINSVDSTTVLPKILSGIWCPIRFTLVHDGRESSAEWTVTYVRMSDYPAHIGRSPPDVVSRHAVNAAHRPAKRCDVSARRSNDSFRFI